MPKFVRLVPLLTLVTSALFADVEFSSNEVTTSGNEVKLKGNVSIKHDFGTINADSATLTQSSGQTPSSFLNAILESEVQIEFITNQTIRSESATIDFSKQEASLSSSDKQIIFFDPDTQITIQSQKFTCKWDEKDHKPQLKNIHADDRVQISFGSDMFLSADDADYTPTSDHKGILKLGSHGMEKPCLISIGDDLLKAESATIEIGSNTLILHRPIGQIATTFIDNIKASEISFTSKNLILDRASGKISLSEQILVDGAAFGQLISNDTVTFKTEKVDERILFKGFSANGESYLTTDAGMKISCNGEIAFDYEQKRLSADGYNTPILYQNGDLVIESQKITLDKLQGTPKLISFLDHVQFSAGGMIGNAGSLNYRPHEHTLEFFSSDEEKVVFYNPDSDTKMCADGITITRDPVTEDNEIRGHGVVKLTFDHKNREQIIEVLNSCAKHPF